MPCYVTGSAIGDANLEASEAQEKAQRVTELLCRTCRRAERQNFLQQLPLSVRVWWEQHKQTDRKGK